MTDDGSGTVLRLRRDWRLEYVQRLDGLEEHNVTDRMNHRKCEIDWMKANTDARVKYKKTSFSRQTILANEAL